MTPCTFTILWLALTAPCSPSELPLLDRWQPDGGNLLLCREVAGPTARVYGPQTWGNCYFEITANLDETPFLQIEVPQVSRSAVWTLTVNDPQPHELVSSSNKVGRFSFDLRERYNWHGEKTFRLYFTVSGSGGSAVVTHVDLSEKDLPSAKRGEGVGWADVLINTTNWERLNNAWLSWSDRGMCASLVGVPDGWGGARTTVKLNADEYPFMEVDVPSLSEKARWRIELGKASTSETRQTGTSVYAYAGANDWSGERQLEPHIVMFGAGDEATVRSVRFTAHPSLSAELVRMAAKPHHSQSKPLLESGSFRVCLEQGCLLVRVSDGPTLLTRFVEPPDMKSLVLVNHDKESAEFKSSFRDGTIRAFLRVFPDTPGLMHLFVRARTSRSGGTGGTGHELACQDVVLKRLTSQSWVAGGFAFVEIPGFGTALYLQDLTSLNPYFAHTHTRPSWVVSVGPHTFGTCLPPNEKEPFPSGTEYTLSDAWLYLTPERSSDQLACSFLFLKALSLIYAHLPKPAPLAMDWSTLAKRSLKDLDNPQCWGSYNGKRYLQPYVNTAGAVAQLTPIMDILAPLTLYNKKTGFGKELLDRLRSALPDFYDPDAGVLRMYAQPGDHRCFDISFYPPIARTALLGDETAKEIILKCAPAIIRHVRDQHYEFPDCPDMTGAYLLYMTQCYRLSGDAKFLDEAKVAADRLAKCSFKTTHEIWVTGQACEGAANLYQLTRDKQYLRLSFITLASIMRNAWLWECDYGNAKWYRTFFGLIGDPSCLDYIAPLEQHQAWRSLLEYRRLAGDALPKSIAGLVDGFLLHGPAPVYATYPCNIPAEARQPPAETFWKTVNDYQLQIPIEDVCDGWHQLGGVGQEVYGAGAAFEFASECSDTGGIDPQASRDR